VAETNVVTKSITEIFMVNEVGGKKRNVLLLDSAMLKTSKKKYLNTK